MAIDKENSKALYDAVSSKFDNIGTYEEFEKRIADKDNRKALYDAVSSQFGNIGTFDEFNARLWDDTPKPPLQRSHEEDAPIETAAQPQVKASVPQPQADAPKQEPQQQVQQELQPQQKESQEYYRPSETDLSRLHTSLSDFERQNQAANEQVKRAQESLTKEGRKKQKALEVDALRHGGSTGPVFGVTHQANAADESAAQQQNAPQQHNTISAVPYGAIYKDGQWQTQWKMPDGSLTTDFMRVSGNEAEAGRNRMAKDFLRKNGDQLREIYGRDVTLDEIAVNREDFQKELENRASLQSAIDEQWKSAEAEYEKYKNGDGGFWDKAKSVAKDVVDLLDVGPLRLVGGAGPFEAYDEYKKNTIFNFDKFVDNAYNSLSAEYKQSLIDSSKSEIISQCKATNTEIPQNIDELAEQAARNYVYLNVNDYAVKKFKPQNQGEYILRLTQDNLASTLRKAGTAYLADSYGLNIAEMQANDLYGEDHTLARITGTVLGMAADPLMYLSGGTASVAAKGVQKIGTRVAQNWVLKGVERSAASRLLASKLSGRIATGAVAGGVNFATFEGVGNAAQQLKTGGEIDPETGKGKGFSVGDVVSSAAHGFVMGSVTGVVSPVLGNYADKLTKATESTAGKMAVRGGEIATSTVLEGTIFSVPEWIDGERDAWDVWTDNTAMMLGFKAQGLFKSTVGVLKEMKATAKEKRGLSFTEKFRKRLDASPADFALTKEEIQELKENGYDVESLLTKKENKQQEKKEAKVVIGEKEQTIELEEVGGEQPRDKNLDGFDMMIDLMQNKNVSEATRAKMYYFATGRYVPASSIVGCDMIANPDGTYTVISKSVMGDVITKKTYKNKDKAQYAVDELLHAMELNSISVGEQVKDAKIDEITDRQYDNVGFVDETIESQRPGSARERIKKETGVNIDEALKKPRKKRTDAEQQAVEQYAKEVFAKVTEPEKRSDRLLTDDGTSQRLLESSPDDGQPQGPTDGAYEEGRTMADDANVKLQDLIQQAQDARKAYIELLRDYSADENYLYDVYKENPLDLLTSDREFTEEQQQVILDYASQKARIDGYIDAVNESNDIKRQEIIESVKKRTSKQGKVRPLTLKVDDKRVYLIDGELTVLEDGTIDVSNSSKQLVVYDDESGKYRIISPNEVSKTEAEISPDEMRDTALKELDAEQQLKSEEVSAATEKFLSADSEEERRAEEEARKAYEAKIAEDKQRADEERQKRITVTAEYESEDGSAKKEEIVIDGKRKATVITEGLNNENGETKTTVAIEGQEFNSIDDALKYIDENPLIAEYIPRNDAGEPDFEAVEPTKAADGLIEFSDNSVESARNIADAQVAQAKAELDELTKKAPMKGKVKLSGSPIAMIKQQKQADEIYKQQKAEHDQQLEAAQKRYAHWQSIQNDIKTRQESTRHEQALAEDAERKRKEAELKAEQERTGANNVGEKVKQKWNNAQKIEGHSDEITLADGTKVKGKYVLVEAGSASASHDPNNAFAPTEGFPIAENGQSVNDRDYSRDKDAQRAVNEIASNYDNRALQSPVVVSKDGVVLSGNNRTMSGDIAAANGTDKAYVEYLKEYGSKYGFSKDQLANMQHPRVVFVPDEDMPYDATTFAKFNAQETKLQSKPEQAVKLGKIVSNEAYGRVIRTISEYDNLNDFYADDEATSAVLGMLAQEGVINERQMPSLRTETTISNAGKELIENVLIGKAFEDAPDAVRELIEFPNLRQSVVMGLTEIGHNVTLGEYGLHDELAKAIDLCYRAKKAQGDVFKQGNPVSPFGLQQGLFDDDFGESQVKDATILMLADLLNSKSPSELRLVLAEYNRDAALAHEGQMDIFTQDVPTKERIIKSIIDNYKNESKKQQRERLNAAVADRKQRVAKSKGEEQGSGDEQTSDVGKGSAEGEGIEGKVEDKQERSPNLLDAVKTLYAKGKEFASKLYGHKHFVVEETPDFMKKLGLSGDRFTIRYGVISRHLDKDNSHYLSEEEWEKLPDALKAPFAITKLSDKDKAYRIYTTLRNSKGEHIVVGVDVKNAGRDLEVNSISTVFGKNTKGGLTKKETIIYEDKKITPEQKSLLSGPNFRQYPDAQELSENKGTNKSETLQEEKVKSEKGTQETPIDKINEHRATEGLEEVSEEEVALRDALNEQLKKSGIDVVTDVEDGERVLAMADGNDVKENKVYHGSGADFDKFDHSHIGEGEGAQAFGWGTYLTEVKGIGEGYARRCFANVGAKYIGNVLAKNEAHLLEFLFVGRTYNELEDFLEGVANSNEPGARRSAHALAMLRKTKPSDWVQSSQVDRLLYTVEIPDDNGKNFLHWESQTPSETVEKIRNYVREHCSEEVAEEFDKQIAYGTDNPDLAEYGQNGENVYNALEYALSSDKKASLALSELGMQGISYPADFMRGGRKDGARNYVIFKEEDAKITDKVRFFKTKNGKAYGFTVGGKIYVDPRIAKADTPIHEYSHLWASMFRDVNPKEWKNLVKLMKDSPLWEEIRKKYPELKTDEEIADEVLAHFSGKRGAERLRQAQQEAMKEKGVSAKAAAISAIERVRKALSTFWKGVCDLLHIHFTSAEEVADRVLSDMLNGVDPMKVKNEAKKGEKTLVGVHNISEDKLEKAMKQGGLANPSVAVIDSSKQKHEGYGDISLIMPSNKVAKRTGKNAGTWQGDAWTPTYPQVERKMSDKGSAKSSKDIQSVPKEMQRSVSNGIDRWLEGQSNSGMAYLFLHERGEAPEMQYAKSKYGEDTYEKLSELTKGNFSLQGLSEAEKNELLSLYIESKFNGDEAAYRRNLEEWVAKNRKRAEENKGLIGKGAKENVELYDKYGIDYKSVERFAQDVRNDHNSTLNPDSNLTTKAAEEYIQSKNLQGEFEKWLEGKTNEYGVKEVIFDGYTPSGKRRYVDNTLENVSRLMKGEGRNGATGWSGSFSDFAARLMPSYSKLEEIRTQKGLLTNDHADVEAFREKWGKVYTELGMKCQPEAKGQFDTYGMERLSEAATQKNPQQYLKEEYGVELSDADAKRLNEMIAAIKKEYPAMYFETKYERPVMFNEFASAVVPKTLKESTKEFLRKQGLTLYEYDKDIEGDRQRAFDEASSGEGIRFQFVGEKGAANADKLEEADRRMDNLRVAREMEKSEKDAKSIKIATGWERGADGKWRYEIPDVKYHPEGDAEYEKIRNRQRWSKELDELSDKVFEGKKLSDKEEKQFDELVQLESEFKADYLSQEKPYLTNWVENDELFASYPELKQTQIIFTDQLPERTAGYYSEKDNTIVVNTKSSLAPESIIAHEVQHAIQRIEGFARGGSIEEIEKDFQRAKEEVRARSWAFQLKETSKELGGDYSQSDVEKALIKEYEDMNMSDMMPDEETRIKGFNYFARGYADRSLDDAIKRFHLDTSTGSNFNSYKEYQKLAGEVESRNVQERMYMTSEERRKSLAAETEDVSREDQIFLYGETGINEMVSPAEMDESAKAERGNRLMNAPAVEVKSKQIVKTEGMTARQAAEKWWKENIGKSLFYDTEIGKVEINEKSIGTSLAHRYGQPKLDAITSLKDGFGNAVYLGTIPDFVRQEGVLNHYFAYPINYDGKRCYVFCRAMQDANKNRLYVHEVFLADNLQKEGNTLQTAAFQPHGGIALYKSILSDILSATNLERNTDSGKNSDENLHFRDENGLEEADLRYRDVEDEFILKEFAEGKTVKAYRTMQVIDGKLYSPMATKVGGKSTPEIKLGVPEQSEEHPEIIKKTKVGSDGIEYGYAVIDKGLGKGTLSVAYNPYAHTSRTTLNDQFSSAYIRPNLVTVEVEVPESELTSGYRAPMSKDSVGEISWHSGSVSGQLAELGRPRRVILTRYDRPVRIIPFREVAEQIAEQLKGTNIEIPFNVVQPQLRQELERLGIPISKKASGTIGNEPGYGKAQYITDEDIERMNAKAHTSTESKTSRATEISEHLNTPVRVITSEKEMEGLSPRQKKAKGWYNTATGEVVVVVPNNADVADVENTVLHEVIGHDGIRVLFPDEKKLNNALDEMYRVSNKGIKDKIDAETQKMYDAEVSRIMERKRKEHEAKGEDANATYYTDLAEAHKEASAKREQMRRDATEEYGADLAGRIGEGGFEKMTAEEKTFWGKIKSVLQEALKRLLDGLGIKSLKKWGDKEWAYIYHEAYKRKKNGGKPTVLDLAESAAMREKTGFGKDVREENGMGEENHKEFYISDRILMDKRYKSIGLAENWLDKKGFSDNVYPLSEYLRNGGKTIKGVLKPSLKNYFKGTRTDFKSVETDDVEGTWEQMKNSGKYEWHKSPYSNSEYLIDTATGDVYRKADHWGNVASCTWTLDGKSIRANYFEPNTAIGKANISDFRYILGTSSEEIPDPKYFNYDKKISEIDSEIQQIQDIIVNRHGQDGMKIALQGLRDSLQKAKERLETYQYSAAHQTPDDSNIKYRDGDDLNSIIENVKANAEQFNAESKDKLSDAVKAIGGDLRAIHKAMLAQRAYDAGTVKSITDLANSLFTNGLLDGISEGDIKRLLSTAKNVTGKKDISKYVQNVMDILTTSQLREAKYRFNSLLKVKGSKVNANGVEVQGELDSDGAKVIKELKQNLGLSEEALAPKIIDALDRMSSTNQVIADNAALRYRALTLAQHYAESVIANEVEAKTLKEELEKATEDFQAGLMSKDAYDDFCNSVEEALRENKLDRIAEYNNFSDELEAMLSESISKADEWREAEKQRISEIQHNANSDMEGLPYYEHHKDTPLQRFMNNPLFSFFLQPLPTFDYMLRLFGNKDANGEGYLWNRFMRQYNDASEKEYKGYADAIERINREIEDIFGDGSILSINGIEKLFELDRKLPTVDVEFWDGGEMKPHTLTQGNLLYMYMVNKMADGRMKLRRMGVTEADMDRIEKILDPRFKEFADWVQEELLPDLRNKYNEVYKNLFGTSMAEIENYFPLKILKNALKQEVDINDPDEVPLPSTITGSVKKRTRNSAALDITNANAFNVLMNHIKEMEHWAAFGEFNRDINTLLSYTRFKNKLLNMTSVYGSGSKLLKNFIKVCKIASGSEESQSVSELDKTAVNLAKGVTAAKVSLRVFTALKQFFSLPAFIADGDTKTLVASLAYPPMAWNWCMKNLPIFEKRWSSRMAGDPRLLKTEVDWSVWRSKVVEQAARIGMAPNAFVDAVTVSIGTYSIYKGKYKKYIDAGLSKESAEKRAKEDATIAFNETQQSNETAYMSPMQTARTWFSVLFTIFRNSSISYTRKLWQHIANLKNRLKGKTDINYMAKKAFREGLTEEQAMKYARGRYYKGMANDIANIAIFAYGLQFMWNIGAYIPYLLFGDDDEQKDEMINDAAIHATYGSIEGLTAGDAISATLNEMTKDGFTKQGLENSMDKSMPLTSDITAALGKLPNDYVAALNDLLNVAVQSGIGVNPQSLTDVVVAGIDAAGDDAEGVHEFALLLGRIVNAPQSQLDKLYFDEINASAEEASKMTPAQLAERFAEYRVMRQAPLTGFLYSEEQKRQQLDKQKNIANDRMKERLISSIDAKINPKDMKRWADEYSEVSKKMIQINGYKLSDPEEYKKQLQELVHTPEYRRYAIYGEYKKYMDQLTRLWLNSKDVEKSDEYIGKIKSLREKMAETMEKADAQ